MKNEILSKKFECVINEALNGKLRGVVSELDRDTRFTDAERSSIRSLAAQRMEAVASLEEVYKGPSSEITSKYEAYLKAIDDSKSLSKKEEELDSMIDERSESLISRWKNWITCSINRAMR